MKNKMAKLKPLRPSLKERKRYVVIEIISEGIIPLNEIINVINEQCLAFMGILTFGKAGVLVLKNQFRDNKGIIRVGHKYVDHLKASLLMITQINKKNVNINIKGVSGILKKARDNFM
jgi:ribonuclease P/MRP protein subunit POP5